MTSAKDHTILTSTNEQGIDRDIVSHLRETFGAKAVSIKTNGDTIESLTVPRHNFRNELKKDSTLRAIIRASETRIQDVHTKPLTLGEVMDAKVYVNDAKAVGASKRDGSGIPLTDSIANLREVLMDWGQVKIPALILILLAGGTLYGAYRLKKIATDMGEDYATQLSEAIESDKGLDNAIKSRAGRQPDSRPVSGDDTSEALEKKAQQTSKDTAHPAP